MRVAQPVWLNKTSGSSSRGTSNLREQPVSRSASSSSSSAPVPTGGGHQRPVVIRTRGLPVSPERRGRNRSSPPPFPGMKITREHVEEARGTQPFCFTPEQNGDHAKDGDSSTQQNNRIEETPPTYRGLRKAAYLACGGAAHHPQPSPIEEEEPSDEYGGYRELAADLSDRRNHLLKRYGPRKFERRRPGGGRAVAGTAVTPARPDDEIPYGASLLKKSLKFSPERRARSVGATRPGRRGDRILGGLRFRVSSEMRTHELIECSLREVAHQRGTCSEHVHRWWTTSQSLSP